MKQIPISLLILLFILSCNTTNKEESSINEKSGMTAEANTPKSPTEIPGQEDYDNSFKTVDGDTINKIDEVGMLQGEWERLHPNGSFKCRGVYKDGKKEGFWERTYSNGNYRYQINTKNGFLEGKCKFFYENGNLKKEGDYSQSKPIGLLKTYYENGNIKSEETYANGKLNGFCKYYDENALLKRDGMIKNDNLEGEWKYYKDLEVSVIVEYQNGIAINTISK